MLCFIKLVHITPPRRTSMNSVHVLSITNEFSILDNISYILLISYVRVHTDNIFVPLANPNCMIHYYFKFLTLFVSKNMLNSLLNHNLQILGASWNCPELDYFLVSKISLALLKLTHISFLNKSQESSFGAQKCVPPIGRATNCSHTCLIVFLIVLRLKN